MCRAELALFFVWGGGGRAGEAAALPVKPSPDSASFIDHKEPYAKSDLSRVLFVIEACVIGLNTQVYIKETT